MIDRAKPHQTQLPHSLDQGQPTQQRRPSRRRRRRSKVRGKRRKKWAAIHNPQEPVVDHFRAQHLVLVQRQVVTEDGRTSVVVDETEGPLSWLASRRGRDGRALIEAHQMEAGERLRADFTRANLMPRITSDWSNPSLAGRRAKGGERADLLTDTIVASRQRVRKALDAVGPEFAGLLVDVCCFLKGLEAIERERAWPSRSGKVVLQLALDRLARHYGYAARARGPGRSQLRAWSAEGGADFGDRG
jgi:Domain of unknown function (DUF6456)